MQVDLDEVVYRMAHDLRGSIRAVGELPGWIVEDLAAQDVVVGPAAQQALTFLEDHADRLNRTLDGLVIYAQIGRAPAGPCDLAACLEEALRAVGLPPDRLTAELEIPHLTCPRPDLLRLLRELLGNALRHHPDRPQVTVATWAEANRVCLAIDDDGPGIPPELRARVLRPMETFETGAAGPGLGLAIAQRILEGQGGTLTLDAPPGGGAGLRVLARLPMGPGHAPHSKV